jgi:peptidoglycan/LPS O-acetylase OafA/YrhL
VTAYHFVGWDGGLWFGGPPFEGTPQGCGAAVGLFGVDIFFVISGVVIPMALGGKTPGSFVTARIVRLFPAYWFAVLAGAAIYRILGYTGPSLGDVLVNLTMMQSAAGVGDVFASQWTLWAELRFYLIAAGLCAVGMTSGRLVALAALWAPAAALCDRTGSSLVSELLVAPYSPLFAGGLAIYGLAKWGLKASSFWLVLAENAAFAAAWTGPARARALASGTGGAVELNSTQVTLCVVACFATVLFGALARLPRRWESALTVAAKPTYCLYLIHLPLGLLIISWTSPHLNPTTVISLAFLSSAAIATAMYRLIERPGSTLLRRALSEKSRSCVSTSAA